VTHTDVVEEEVVVIRGGRLRLNELRTILDACAVLEDPIERAHVWTLTAGNEIRVIREVPDATPF